MNRLIITGNGFDLAHGLPTSYSDFCRHVRENDKELYEFLENYVKLELNDNGLWSNLERNLCTFEHSTFYSDIDNTEPSHEDFKLSDMLGVVNELQEQSEIMVEKLKRALYDWLDKIDYPNKRVFHLDPNARYLTFNYTATLSRLYSIQEENILYIHHSIATHGYDLVFGHGTTIKQKSELDDEGNGNYPSSSYYEAECASKILLTRFYKDTQAIIEKHARFFDSFRGINEIFVLGHSLNGIDLPYFEYLNTIVRKAKWTVSYYSDSELEDMRCTLSKIGMNDVRFIKLDKTIFNIFEI